MPPSPRTRGYTLVELTLTVIAIGVTLISMIPRFEYQSEKPVVEKALRWSHVVRQAQEAFLTEHGQYAHALNQLRSSEEPVGFRILGDFDSSDWTRDWNMKLVREDYASAFGDYSLVIDQKGLDLEQSTVLPALVENLAGPPGATRSRAWTR